MTPPIRFLGGKGGVGKTTLAAAVGCASAAAGRRTLVVSTDPAHSLGDVLDTRLDDDPREVRPGLWAAEIDGEVHARRRIAQIMDDAADAVPREVLPAVRAHLDRAVQSPGTMEAALLDRLGEFVETVPAGTGGSGVPAGTGRPVPPGGFDRLVVDSAPTGHMLRLLTLPDVLSGWIEGLARSRERHRDVDRMFAGMLGHDADAPDPLLTRLHARRDRTLRLRSRLRSDAAVHLVVVPEPLVWAETRRAADTLDAAGVPLGTALVNRVVPETESGVLALRRDAQDEVLAAVCARLGPPVQIPLLAHGPAGADALDAVVEVLRTAGWR